LAADACLLLQLPAGGHVDGLVGVDEAAGQGPLTLERLIPPLDQQDAEPALPHGHQGHVDGEEDLVGLAHPNDTPAARISSMAASVVSGATPATRSDSTCTSNP